MKLARDTWLIFQREATLMFRSPVWLVFALTQPVTYLVFFAPFLLPGLSAVGGPPSYSDAYRVYVPGLLIAMSLFGGMYAGYNLLAAIRSGVIERCRVTPVSRTALVLGRALREVVAQFLQATVITVLALPFGLRIGPVSLLLAYLMVTLTVLLTTAISYDITLLVPNEGKLGQVVNTMTQPLALLAGVLIPLALAPPWIQRIAVWNPFSWATNGMRALYSDRIDDPAVWQGLAIIAVLAVFMVTWSTHLFARTVR